MSISEGTAGPSSPLDQTPVPELLTDRCAAYPALLEARAAATSGDLAAMAEIYRRTGDDPAMLAAVCWEFAQVDGVEPVLRAAVERAAADSPTKDSPTAAGTSADTANLARLLLAIANIHIGWTIRSSARAKHVSSEQFAAFRRHLCIAEPLLIEVTAVEPDNVVAWHARLTTGRGLSVGTAEVRRRYHQLSKYCSGMWQAQSSMLQQLCPKWTGSFPEMFAFVREAVEAAAPGSITPALIVVAHLERTGDMRTAEMETYLSRPEVRQEIDRAAALSVLHPEHRQPFGWVTATSLFATYYTMVSDQAAAARHIRTLGPYLDEQANYCWTLIEERYHQYRAAAFGGATS